MPDTTNIPFDQAKLIEQFKAGLDPESAAAIAERVTKAEAELAELKGKPDLSGDLDAANARALKAEGDLQSVTADRDRLGELLNQAQAEAASVTEREAAGKPRRFAQISADDRTPAAELLEMIHDADDVEVVFTDGRQEIKGIGTRIVSGSAWKQHLVGVMLTQPVDIYGAAQGKASYSIEGYALVLDGKLAAHTKRDPLIVAAGGHVRLQDDIYF